MATQENLKIALFEGTVEKVSKQLNISIDTTVLLIKAVKTSADKVNQSFYRTCNILIKIIQKQMKESLQYAAGLDQMDEVVRRWCPEGILASRGFSTKNLSINELLQKMNSTIAQFKESPDNVEILDELVEYDKEINYTLKNLRGFLYEMVCEDDPNGDHSELEKLVFHNE